MGKSGCKAASRLALARNRPKIGRAALILGNLAYKIAFNCAFGIHATLSR
jgi:hypothetical protein